MDDDNANRLIKARTEQLRSAITMIDILTQALNDIKAKVEAKVDQALKEADTLRKAEIARVD